MANLTVKNKLWHFISPFFHDYTDQLHFVRGLSIIFISWFMSLLVSIISHFISPECRWLSSPLPNLHVVHTVQHCRYKRQCSTNNGQIEGEAQLPESGLFEPWSVCVCVGPERDARHSDKDTWGREISYLYSPFYF